MTKPLIWSIDLHGVTADGIELETGICHPFTALVGKPGSGKTSVLNALRHKLGEPVMTESAWRKWLAGGSIRATCSYSPKDVIVGPRCGKRHGMPAIDFSGPQTSVKTIMLWGAWAANQPDDMKAVRLAFSRPSQDVAKRLEVLKRVSELAPNEQVDAEIAQLTETLERTRAEIEKAKTRCKYLWAVHGNAFALAFEEGAFLNPIVNFGGMEGASTGSLKLGFEDHEDTRTMSTMSGGMRGVWEIRAFVALVAAFAPSVPTLMILDDAELAGITDIYRHRLLRALGDASGATDECALSVVFTTQGESSAVSLGAHIVKIP